MRSFLHWLLSSTASSEPGKLIPLHLHILSDLKLYEISELSNEAGVVVSDLIESAKVPDDCLYVENLCVLLSKLRVDFIAPKGGWCKVLASLLDLDKRVRLCDAKCTRTVAECVRICIAKAIRSIRLGEGEGDGMVDCDVIVRGMCIGIDSDECLRASSDVISAMLPTSRLFETLADVFFTPNGGVKPDHSGQTLHSISRASLRFRGDKSVAPAVSFMESLLVNVILKTKANDILCDSSLCYLFGDLLRLSNAVGEKLRNEFFSHSRDVLNILTSSSPSFTSFSFGGDTVHLRFLLSVLASNGLFISQVPSSTLHKITSCFAGFFDAPLEKKEEDKGDTKLAQGFASFVNHGNSEPMKSAISSIKRCLGGGDEEGGNSAPFLQHVAGYLRCYRILVESAKGTSGRSATASVAEICLRRSCALLVQPPSDAPLVATEAIEMQIALVGKTDLIVMSSRQICVLLAGLNRVLLAEEGNHKSIETFLLCATLVQSVMKHYTKTTYSCSSLLVCSIRSLLRTCLTCQECEDASSRSLEVMGRTVSRLLEYLVPSKDIFKKHIVTLLLDYVSHLVKGISDVVKESLFDGVFAMLQMMGSHEKDQLNVMLDSSGRAVFKKVYAVCQSETFDGSI